MWKGTNKRHNGECFIAEELPCRDPFCRPRRYLFGPRNFAMRPTITPHSIFKTRLFVICVLYILFNWTQALSTAKTRRSVLLPWNEGTDGSKGNGQTLGWVVERKDNEAGTFQVVVGNSVQAEPLTINLPYFETEESLASSLWPGGLAGACLCYNPLLQNHFKGKNILELGCGVGLTGQVAAIEAAKCTLTDRDEDVLQRLRELLAGNGSNMSAEYLEWRDEHKVTEDNRVDAVIGMDVAYYYFLLRPMMDTARAFLKHQNSFLMVVGPTTRESQRDLYHAIKNGCYNQMTDEHEGPWPGETKLLLYKLQMEEWTSNSVLEEEAPNGKESTNFDSVFPISAILHCNPGYDFPQVTEFDYVASEQEINNFMTSF